VQDLGTLFNSDKRQNAIVKIRWDIQGNRNQRTFCEAQTVTSYKKSSGNLGLHFNSTDKNKAPSIIGAFVLMYTDSLLYCIIVSLSSALQAINIDQTSYQQEKYYMVVSACSARLFFFLRLIIQAPHAAITAAASQRGVLKLSISFCIRISVNNAHDVTVTSWAGIKRNYFLACTL
jgi:hypothetical protein